MARAGRAKARRADEPRPDGPEGGRTPAGAKVVAAFEEAIASMRDGPTPGRLTARAYKIDLTPRGYGPDDVRRVRGSLGMGQAVFARFLGVDAGTLRSWEKGDRPPDAIACRFMQEIEADPDYWRHRVDRLALGREADSPTD